MRIGYARVSTGEQELDLQFDEVEEAGCERIYEEKTSGAAKNRPELEKCMDSLREGDTLVVWSLDRFGRSPKDLVQKMDTLEEKGVDFVSLAEGTDTTTAQGKLTSTSSEPWLSLSGNWPGSGRWLASGPLGSGAGWEGDRAHWMKRTFLKSRPS